VDILSRDLLLVDASDRYARNHPKKDIRKTNSCSHRLNASLLLYTGIIDVWLHPSIQCTKASAAGEFPVKTLGLLRHTRVRLGVRAGVAREDFEQPNRILFEDPSLSGNAPDDDGRDPPFEIPPDKIADVETNRLVPFTGNRIQRLNVPGSVELIEHRAVPQTGRGVGWMKERPFRTYKSVFPRVQIFPDPQIL
jgi:hypothetical protein